MLALRIGLRQADWSGLSNFIVEGDSSCDIRWSLGSSRPPWRLADAVEEVLELGLKLMSPIWSSRDLLMKSPTA